MIRTYYPNSDPINNTAWREAKVGGFGTTEPDATVYTATERNTISTDDGNQISQQGFGTNIYQGHRVRIRVSEAPAILTQLVLTINGDWFQGVTGSVNFFAQIYKASDGSWETFDSVSPTGGVVNRTSTVTKTTDLANYIDANGDVFCRAWADNASPAGGAFPVAMLDFVSVAVTFEPKTIHQGVIMQGIIIN